MKYLMSCYLSFLFLLSASTAVSAQSTSLFFLRYPGSISSFGMGEQATALKSADDALSYNPANLVFAKGNSGFSFFSFPQRPGGYDFPFTQVEGYFNYPSLGVIGIQYRKLSLKIPITTEPAPEGTGSFLESFEETYSAAIAKRFNDNLSAGLEVRYARERIMNTLTNVILFSAGVNYEPDILDRRLKISFSLINFAAEDNGIIWPARMNLGMSGIFLSNKFLTLAAQAVVSKPFNDTWTRAFYLPHSGRGRMTEQAGKSSFESLFSDWKDFPGDLTVHTGLNLGTKPIDLGNNFLLRQNFYLGSYSRGSREGTLSYFTHGVEMGLEYNSFILSLGYAGRWHKVQQDEWLEFFRDFPEEAVQVNFAYNSSISGIRTLRETGIHPDKLYFSLGFGFPIMRSGLVETAPGTGSPADNNPDFSLSASFYFSRKSALVTELSYRYINKDPEIAGFFDIPYRENHAMQFRNESLSLSAAYRYHPFEKYESLFFEGGIGIARINPYDDMWLKYFYKPLFRAAAGYIIPLTNSFYLCPEISFQNIPVYDAHNIMKLAGSNQLNLGIKMGFGI